MSIMVELEERDNINDDVWWYIMYEMTKRGSSNDLFDMEDYKCNI